MCTILDLYILENNQWERQVAIILIKCVDIHSSALHFSTQQYLAFGELVAVVTDVSLQGRGTVEVQGRGYAYWV